MKCPNCNHEINEDNQFCPYCGVRLVKKDEQVERQIKEIRFKQISYIMNKILNISCIIAVIFAIIGIFGPVLEFTGLENNFGIGGLSWFTYLGWSMLSEGQITQGPFYLTLVLYIIVFISVLVVSSLAIYKSINSLRRTEECKTVPHIIALSLIHSVYSAFIFNFYYEYNSYGDYYVEAGSGWGETLYSLAIPLFTIALIIYLIMKAVFTARDNKKIVRHIFALVAAFSLTSSISSVFTILGFQDFNINEQDAFGTLHYFDLVSNMPSNVASLLVISFIFGIIFIGLIVANAIIILRNLVKYDTIDRKLILTFAIAQAVFSFAMLVVAIIFSEAINSIEGWYDNHFCLTSNFALIIASSLLVLGLSIAVYCIKEDEGPKASPIIDQEVIEKDSTEA